MSGSATRDQTLEAAQDAVTAAYASELGRQPDAGGLATYASLLLAGVPLGQVQSDIAQSPEAQADVQNLYMATLGRAADPTGIAGDTQALATGTSLAQLRTAIVQSPEGQGAIQKLYKDVLGRPADPGGLALDTQALLAGASLAQLRTGLAGSPEAAQAVAAAYQSYLLRTPSASEIAANTSALAGGTSFAAVKSGIILSPENAQVIQTLYQQYLDRPATAVEVQQVRQSLFGGGTFEAVQLGLDAQHRLQVSTVPDQTAALTAAYEDVFGHAPIDAPNSNASTIPTLQDELSLGRPLAEVEQVTDYQATSNGITTQEYGYVVPAHYSSDGFSLFLEQSGSNESITRINVSSAVPIPLTGASGAAGPDTITLDLAQLNTAPLAFSASLDGRSLGQGTLAASSSFGTPSVGRVSFTGDFGAGRELDLSFGTIPLQSLYVVTGTLNGRSFLLDGAVNGTGSSIALFPHANSSTVVQTPNYPY